MKKFILIVPDNEGITLCSDCPWIDNGGDVCKYCDENNLCRKYNFAKAQIEEYNEDRN